MSLRILAVLVVLAIAGAVAVRWLGSERTQPASAPLSRFTADLESLARAFPAPGSGPIEVPRDHASKPDEFVESWFFAGVLQGHSDNRIGVQLLFERVAVTATPAVRESGWAAGAVWRAMLLVEPAGAVAMRDDRLSRGAFELAGAAADPAVAWVDDWRIAFDPVASRVVLEARGVAAGLQLELDWPAGAPAAFATAAYRGYWQPGLLARGRVEFDGAAHEVRGTMFMERSWGRAQPTGRGQLALARLWVSGAGGALRCERLQRRAGGGVPLLECITQDGSVVADVELAPDPPGRRPVQGVEQPLHWRVAAPSLFATTRLEPLADAHPPAIEGGWRGVLTGADGGSPWGVLVLSNFDDPAGASGANR